MGIAVPEESAKGKAALSLYTDRHEENLIGLRKLPLNHWDEGRSRRPADSQDLSSAGVLLQFEPRCLVSEKDRATCRHIVTSSVECQDHAQSRGPKCRQTLGRGKACTFGTLLDL
jgi:hypothetical protein